MLALIEIGKSQNAGYQNGGRLAVHLPEAGRCHAVLVRAHIAVGQRVQHLMTNGGARAAQWFAVLEHEHTARRAHDVDSAPGLRAAVPNLVILNLVDGQGHRLQCDE